ncbi:MAG: four helix bundle protein [Opitutaceae bacterium]|jgi:four helix bundle protein|nr:four helix bundle protein [Opitutaceae bacterium]
MENPSQSFREVVVWQKAHAFTLAIYALTNALPSHESFGLISQLRRAAASIPANFVEGFRKRTVPDKVRFYNMAEASADECLYHLILAHDLNYADTTALQADLEEVSRILQGYINGMKR